MFETIALLLFNWFGFAHYYQMILSYMFYIF